MSTITDIGHDVFVADPLPMNGPGPLPNGAPRTFQPLAVTLIHGRQDAVLVDPPLTREQAEQVGDWVEASGKRLTHIVAGVVSVGGALPQVGDGPEPYPASGTCPRPASARRSHRRAPGRCARPRFGQRFPVSAFPGPSPTRLPRPWSPDCGQTREVGLPPASFAYPTAAADRGYAARRIVPPEIRVEWLIL